MTGPDGRLDRIRHLLANAAAHGTSAAEAEALSGEAAELNGPPRHRVALASPVIAALLAVSRPVEACERPAVRSGAGLAR